MGRKVHPMGFRTGIIRDWQARWYADKQYAELLHEDIKLRQAIQSRYTEAGISMVEIDRQASEVSITVHTARPGVVIGRGGQRVDEMRAYLENLIGKKVRLNIREIRQTELDAYLVARAIAEQIGRRVAYRRAVKQAIFRTIQAGAKGIKVSCAGRLGGAEIARRQTVHQGRVPLHTLRADIDYGFTEAHTTLGQIGIKVWIYKGDILPEPKEPEVREEEAPSGVVEEPAGVVEQAEPSAGAVEQEEEPAGAVEQEEEPAGVVEQEEESAGVVEQEEESADAVEQEEEPAGVVEQEEASSDLVDKEEGNATTQTGEIPQES